MLYGVESKAVLEFVTDHKEKKFLRNLLTALQELDGGKRRVGKGQGKGGQSRQVSVCIFVCPRVWLGISSALCIFCAVILQYTVLRVWSTGIEVSRFVQETKSSHEHLNTFS